MTTKLVWATPDVDKHIGYIARVSNPDNQDNPDVEKLLKYMMAHGHTSPFEMASACVEINTTRDIGRQILRHRSFSFQEFSQRYASVDQLATANNRECRLQDTKNRQNSIEALSDSDISHTWNTMQDLVIGMAYSQYHRALQLGIAKEQARALLPEGLTMSRMYMSGTFRSWIHYLTSRLDPSTQKEHRQIATSILGQLREVAPITMGVFFNET